MALSLKCRAITFALIGTCVAGCQVVFGYEDFEASRGIDAGGPPPHPCEVLPRRSAITGSRGTSTAVWRVDLPDRSCIWIDQREVTVSQFQSWLVAIAGQAPDWAAVDTAGDCKWKQGMPSDPARNSDDSCRGSIDAKEAQPFEAAKPIRCVDWCDAVAYCAWAGERLCYGVNNSGILVPKGKLPEWNLACTAGDRLPYPYGAYDPLVCNIGQSEKGCEAAKGGTFCGPTSVGFKSKCKEAEDGAPLDLIGNVREWVNTCDANGGGDAVCNRHGGSYADPAATITCAKPDYAPRRARDAATGFRCCADLTAQDLTTVQNGMR